MLHTAFWMALFECVAAMEMVCKDSVGGDRRHHTQSAGKWGDSDDECRVITKATQKFDISTHY